MPSPERDLAVSPADLAACRALLAQGSKSFALAGHLLPPRVSAAVTALYAFCRVADDIIDSGGGSPATLHGVRIRVRCIYAGVPYPHPADRAFAAVVAVHKLPRSAAEALVEGFSWDASGRTYETLDDVLGYAARVAGSVGVMMSVIMGRPHEMALARAADLGMAMQLTNIVRDIGEDAWNGRLYLPRQWLRAGGLDPDAWLRAPRPDPVIRQAALRLLEESERLYRRGEFGISLLPQDCRPAIRAARLIYGEIGAAIRRDEARAVMTRRVIGRGRKLWLLLKALQRQPDEALSYAGRRSPPPLAAARFLWESSPQTTARAAPDVVRPRPARWDLPGRFLTVLPILEKLARTSRGLPAGTGDPAFEMDAAR